MFQRLLVGGQGAGSLGKKKEQSLPAAEVEGAGSDREIGENYAKLRNISQSRNVQRCRSQQIQSEERD